MNKIDVLCVGHASYDLVFSVPHHPSSDEKCAASSLVSCRGGPAANAAVTVSRLGYSAAFAGYLGNDVFGEMHFLELRQEDILPDLIVRGTSPTPLSVALVKPDGRRSLVNYRGSTKPLPRHSINFTDIDPTVILFDGHQPLISTTLAENARERGLKTILDAGSLRRGIEELITLVDYLVCSERFAHQFTGERDERQAVSKLHEYAPTGIITLGERGLIWKSPQGMGVLPAFAVNAVDSTGAGDTFHGAFAVCLAAKKEWEQTLHYASAAAALCCTKIGSRPGIPTAQEVSKFLDSEGSRTLTSATDDHL